MARRLTVKHWLTVKRRAKTRSESYLDEETNEAERVFVAPGKISPSRQTEQKERMALVRQAVSALPADLKEVVIMKEFEEMTFQEISDTLELPLSTVKSRLYTALKQLRMKLARNPIEVV